MLTQREKVLLALGGSVLLHLVVLFIWAILSQWIPGAQAIATAPGEPETLKVELLEEEKPENAPVPTPEPSMKPFVDTTGLVEATPPPGSAKLASGKSTVAASEEPPTGDKPLPTQQGKKIPQFAFATRTGNSAEESVATPETLTQPPETAPEAPKPTAPPPMATPPAKSEQISNAEQLAMLTPGSIPVAPPAEPNPYDPAFRPPSDLTEPPMPTPDRASHHATVSALRAAEDKTSMSGNVSRSGPSSIDSESTAAGRYKSTVVRILKSSWFSHINQRSDVISYGMVTLHVTVDRYGRTRPPLVLSNTGNQALASVALAAIMNARIPPMPDDTVPQFDGGQFQLDLELNCE